MKRTRCPQTAHRTAVLIFTFLLFALPATAQGDAASFRATAEELMKQDKMIEALPVIEKWIALDPKSAVAQEKLGFALLGKWVHSKNPAERRSIRIAARNAFIRARDLGNNSNFIRAMIESLPEDGSEGEPFSADPRSHALTVAGEKAFTQGKIDEALDLYKQAAAADAKNYYAPLFVGDMYLKKEAFADAEIWYQKAITVDPYRETAYRYSGTPLMRQRKFDQARERYIDAWITEPYNRMALNGILSWGQATNTRLAHPQIDVPEIKTGADGKSSSTVNINPLADDGSISWMMYVATRELWRSRKFKESFPGESQYRHTLAEETDALRAVVTGAKTMKGKTVNAQISMLEKMDADGVLEAFILLAKPTRGIAEDHAAYLRAHRDKLRLYVTKYVIGGGK